MSATSICYGSLRALGITAAARRWRDAGRILCYHNVVDTTETGIGGAGLHMPRHTFERQMRWLKDHFSLLSLHEFVDRLERGASLRSTAAVVFDDGYHGVFEHAAPVLHRLGIPATVFVVAEAAGRAGGFWWDHPRLVSQSNGPRHERWLTELRGDESAILADAAAGECRMPHSLQPAGWEAIRPWHTRGISIGVHSATHRCLPTLNDAELDREIVASRDILAAAVGVAAFFAYPYGRCDARVRARVRDAGYRAALGLHAGVAAAGADTWQLNRINVPAGISDAAFEAWTAGLQPRKTRL